jgi:uncharacterized membrane protein YhaH (DUF805 family)
MESYLHVWKNYAVFSGRANRTEFWMFILFNFIFTVAIAFVEGLAGSGGNRKRGIAKGDILLFRISTMSPFSLSSGHPLALHR